MGELADNWVIEEAPDTNPDGTLDFSGAGMIVRAPNGKRYKIIVEDICEIPDEDDG